MENKHFIIIVAVAALAVIAGAAVCFMNGDDSEQSALYLGNVITMDEDNPTAEAVFVRNGMIEFVGSKEDAEKYCDEKTQVIDYGEYSIYPGFMEAHTHVSLAAIRTFGMFEVSMGVPLEENVKEFEKYYKEHPGQEYYLGYGWIIGSEEPTAAMLDAVCPDKPVILQSRGGHEAWVNTKCLQLLDYSPEYIKEAGPQQIHVDENGKPTGFLQETPAINLGKNPPYSVEELKGFVLKWQDQMIASGLTAVSDAGMELFGDKILQAIHEIDEQGDLKIRIRGLSLVRDNTDTPEEDMARIAQLAKLYNSEYFKIIGAKIFLDGTTEGHTSWLLEPYTDMPESTGIKRFSDVDKMAALITAANERGMLVHGHVMGDGAANAFASAVEKSVKETGNYDQRNAAAHLELVSEADKALFAKYGIIAASFYQFSPKIPGDDSMVKRIGPERAKSICPAQSFIDAGVVTVGHSDYPIAPIENISWAIFTATQRALPFIEPDVPNPDEKMSSVDALKSVTSNVAYMWHEEKRMGTIEVGKIANMSVQVIDYMNADVEELELALLFDNVATIIDGKEVYRCDPIEMTEEEQAELLESLKQAYELWSQQEEQPEGIE